MKCFIFSLFLGCVGCSKNPAFLILDAGSTCQAPTGYFCEGDSFKPLLAGDCMSNLDCPAPYACVKNQCQNSPTFTIDPTTSPNTVTSIGTPIWFATDALKPGSTSTSGAADYIYNIMSKGRQSLDDFCMSQAQQSPIETLRKVGSWTGLVVSSNSTTFNHDVLVLWYAIMGGSLSPTSWYAIMGGSLSPTSMLATSAAVSWDKDNNSIYDKNGYRMGNYQHFWSGLANSSPVARGQTMGCNDGGNCSAHGGTFCPAGVCFNDRETCDGLYAPYDTSTDSHFDCTAYCDKDGRAPANVATVDYKFSAGFGSKWSVSDNTVNYGSALLAGSGCIGGIAHYTYYGPANRANFSGNAYHINTSAVFVHPIICLANTIPQ